MELVRIDRSLLPADEHQAADFIEHNLLMLQANAVDFRACADLYLFAHDRKMEQREDFSGSRMVSWIKISGRSGAISACAFSMIMNLISEARCPTIKSKWDLAAKKSATKLMAEEFPEIAHIRNATAHPGELSGHPKERDKHRLKQGEVFSGLSFFGEGSFVADAMNGMNDKLIFSASFKGRKVGYELSMTKADVLDMVAQHYRRAFFPLEDQSTASWRNNIG